MPMFNSTKRVFARERLTATNAAAIKLTQDIYDDNLVPLESGVQHGMRKSRATGAIISMMSGTGTMNVSDTGSNPTLGATGADVGKPVLAAESIVLESHDAIVNFRGIAITSDAIFEVEYLR